MIEEKSSDIRLKNYLEDGYKILYPILRILRNALRDPRQIPDLLLLQLHVAEEHSVLELLQERLLVQEHLHAEESVLQLRRSSKVVHIPIPIRLAGLHVAEERAVLRHALAGCSDLVDVVGLGELVVSLGPQATDGRE